MGLRRKLLACIVLAGAFADSPAHAQSLTIQGRVTTAAGTPISGTAVQFRVQIKAPSGGQCVLFDETHVLDLSTTNGLFSVSLNDGSGTVNTPTTYTLEQAVSNRAAFTVNSSYCSSGSGAVTYTPGTGDNRKVVIQFYDPASMSGFEQIPAMDLNPMAFAMESRTVGGYPATSMLRVDTAGIPDVAPALTSGEASELQLLARGTSTKYTPASATNGAQIPAYSADPASPPAGSIWYNSTTGELHYRTSGGTQVVGAGGGGGGTITSITVSGGLSGGGSSGAVSIGLPTGSAAQVLRYNGGNWVGYSLALPDLLSTSLGSAVTSAGCTAGQTMYYDSTTKELKCQSIGLASSDLSGTLGTAHGGTGLTAGTVGAIPYFSSTSAMSLLAAGSNGDVLTMNGAGVPVWQSLPAASFSGTGTANRLAKFTGSTAVGNSILTDDGTNVGIGTTAPIAKLEVAGSLRLADGGETCSAGANVGMMKYSGGSLFFCNASGWQTLGVSGAGLTSLNGLTANTQTFAIGSAGTSPAWSSAGSVHTLNLPTASASNSGVLSSADWSTFNGKLSASANFAGDVTGTYNANVVTKLQGVALSTTAPAAGQALKLVGSTWTPSNLGFGDLKTTGGAATMASAVCNAGQTMYYDSTTGDLKCQSIALGNASISGALGVANGGTGATSTSQNYVFAGPTSGSGAPSFRALTTADISGLTTYWASATGGINYAGGNVGVGTGAPAYKLDVAGTINAAGSIISARADTGAEGGRIYSLRASDNAQGFYLQTYGTGTTPRFRIVDMVNTAERFVIDAGGNVGINTTVPTAKLEVSGSIRLADGGESCSAGANVGMMKYSGGSLFFCNASGWQTLGVSGAGLTSLNGLSANTQTFAIGSAGSTPAWSSSGSTHTLNLPTASASNSGLLSSTDWSSFNGKLNASATFAGDVTGTYNANVVTKIQGVAVGTTAPTSGQFLKFTTSWNPANLTFGDLKTTGGAATLATAACNAGQTMYYDSTTGDLKCQSIALGNASITGILPVANGGTGASSTSQNYVFAGPTSGSGAPSFRQLTAGDLPASASYWQAATGGISYTSGSVGVGTTAPVSSLDVSSPSSTTVSIRGGVTGQSLVGLFTKPDGNNLGGSTNLGWAVGARGDSFGSSQSDLFFASYWNGSGWNQIFNITPGGNVGIGTTNPSQKLEVTGVTKITSPTQYTGLLVNNGSNNVAVMQGNGAGNDNGTIGLLNGGANNVYLTASGASYLNGGNVGIGTTAPAATLEVNGGVKQTGTTTFGYAGAYGTSWIGATSNVWGQPYLHLGGETSGGVRRMGLFNDVTYITGNVGIGTTTPTSALYVNQPASGVGIADFHSGNNSSTGGVAFSSPTSSVSIFPNLGAGSYNTLVQTGDSALTFTGGTVNTGGFVLGPWSTVGGAGIRILSNGNVGVGAANPAQRLEVNGAIKTSTSATDCPSGWTCTAYLWDVSIASLYYTNLAQRSDIRLKKEVSSLDADENLQRLLNLRPVSYLWKDPKDGKGKQFGFIAQEVEKTFPEIVTTGGDERKIKSVSYISLVSPLVKAVQSIWQHLGQHDEKLKTAEREIAQLKEKDKEKDRRLSETEAQNKELKARLDRLEKLIQAK